MQVSSRCFIERLPTTSVFRTPLWSFKMADRQDAEEMEDFLSKVDEIESIMKGLTSGDTEKQSSAMKKADVFLDTRGEEATPKSVSNKGNGIKTKTGFDRTCINEVKDEGSCASALPGGMEIGSGAAGAEDFMKAVSKDAKERAARNKQRQAQADILKEKGNSAFKVQKYEDAIKHYTDALEQVKSNTALYTNRAQAFIKVGKHREAIDDCETALKLDEKCIKAYVHKGKGFQAQQQFDDAIATFNKALQNLPRQEKILNGYIVDAESARSKYLQEREAEKLIEEYDEEALSVQTCLETLQLPDQSTASYLHAAKTLATLLSSNINKTLFRTRGGFYIISEKNNTAISRFWEGAETCTETEDIELECEVVKILTEACTDNDYNVQEFLKTDHCTSFSRLLRDATSPVIRSCVTSLFYQLSQTEEGRKGLLKWERMQRVIEALFTIVSQETNTSVVAMSTVNNLALEPEFCEKYSTLFDKNFLSNSRNFLLRLCKVCSKGAPDTAITWSLVSSGLSAMANMARDTTTRERIAGDQGWWDACLKFMDRYAHISTLASDTQVRGTVHAVLGLLANICSQKTQLVESKAPLLMTPLIEMIACRDEELVERCLAVLRYLLGYSTEALRVALLHKLYVHFVLFLKSCRRITVKHAVKCLALCTIDDEQSRKAVLNNNGVKSLVELFSSHDEVVVGNAALCLGHCAVLGEVCQQIDTDTVEVLLKLATNDKLSIDVRHNTVLCLSKLATGDVRLLEALRKLKGFEIIHSVYKEKENTS